MDPFAGGRPLPQPPPEAPPQRVVVGVDGSPASEAALRWAIDEAQVAGAELLVCHAYVPQHIVRPVPDAAAGTVSEGRARQRLEAAMATAGRRLGRWRVRGDLATGDAASALIQAAPGALMVVVGSQGHFGQAARLTGSTALRVASQAECPAVVVRPLVAGVRGPFAGHVVVGVDDGEPARSALGFGFRYAALHEIPVVAVHVAAGWPGDFWTDERMLQTYFVEEPESEALLAAAVEPWHHRFPAVPVKRAVFGGDPVRGLLRAGGGAGLLVVGDRRRDSFRRLVLGSVSQGVAGHASCPVAVVHGPRPW